MECPNCLQMAQARSIADAIILKRNRELEEENDCLLSRLKHLQQAYDSWRNAYEEGKLIAVDTEKTELDKCPINCDGGCPTCSYALEGKLPAHDEHTFECHQTWTRWWLINPDSKTCGPNCICPQPTGV